LVIALLGTAAPAKAAKRWYSRAEAADYLGMSLRWIEAHCTQNPRPTIPCYRHGRGGRQVIRFDVADLDAYLASARQGD